MRKVVFFKNRKDIPVKYLGTHIMIPETQGEILNLFEDGVITTLCIGPEFFTGWKSRLMVTDVVFEFYGTFDYAEAMQAMARFRTLLDQ
jgi:hypothetical protein